MQFVASQRQSGHTEFSVDINRCVANVAYRRIDDLDGCVRDGEMAAI